MEKHEAEPKQIKRTGGARQGGSIVSKPRPNDPEAMIAPVPWSLAWSDDGELTPQDRFDLLQSLVLCESQEVQPTLIAVMEQMALHQVSALHNGNVTRLCA